MLLREMAKVCLAMIMAVPACCVIALACWAVGKAVDRE